jgi:phosphoglycerate kinase
MEAGINTLDDFALAGKTVLLRVDINSPIDRETKQLANDNRIQKSLPTIKELADAGAKVVLLAHQGDTEDYHNLVSLEPHAKRLAELLGRPVAFIDDIAGPAAIERIRSLRAGELLLLNNVRYYAEEVSTFVNFVKLTPMELADTRLVRNLAPLADLFVNEAFAAAHRYSPSLVGFAEVLPTAAGRLLIEEFGALARVKETPQHPCVYVLGGSRIADAFSMMEQVLSTGAADRCLTCGLNGEVMVLARGASLGPPSERLIEEKGLIPFIQKAKELDVRYGDKISSPIDFAVSVGGARVEIGLDRLPSDELLVDIGRKTIELYEAVIGQAATIFVNGPAGIYEKTESAEGTRRLWNAIADAPGYSVIGGGDSVAAGAKFGVLGRMGYVCTSGGGMVRFLSGQELPVITALRRAAERQESSRAH